MAWRTARLAAVLALGGLGCGRTWIEQAGTETSTEAGTASTGGTAGLDTGSFDTGRPTSGLDTGGLDSGGPITVTATFTTGFDSGVLDTGFDEVTGFPGTTDDTSATTATTTTTTATDTDGGTTSVGTTDPGTTTDGGTTDGGTTDGGTTDGDPTGGDPTCLDAVDCVLACGGASFTCIGQCNDGLSPADAAAFNDLETCIIFACVFSGACGFDFDDPACVACRVDGQLDPATLECDDEAAACN